jgi:hypothetical protein
MEAQKVQVTPVPGEAFRLVPPELAAARSRPWGDWADGAWWRVEGLDQAARHKFMASAHSWAYRKGYRAKSATLDGGATLLFRIVKNLESSLWK